MSLAFRVYGFKFKVEGWLARLPIDSWPSEALHLTFRQRLGFRARGWGSTVLGLGCRVSQQDGGVSGGGAARAEDAQGTPTQSLISPSIRVYEYTKIRVVASPEYVPSFDVLGELRVWCLGFRV